MPQSTLNRQVKDNALSAETAAKAAAALGVDVGWLLTGKGEARPKGGWRRPADETPASEPLDAEIPPTYRGLLQQMERVLAASEYAPEVKLELLGRVNDGMRIAGLMAEGELSRERIRALVDERKLSRHRQGIIGGEQEGGRDRTGKLGGEEVRALTEEEIKREAERLVRERAEAAERERDRNLQ